MHKLIGVAILALCAWLPAVAGTLVLSQDGFTVYDTANNITWLADWNLAASNRFGLPACTASSPTPCINTSGSMSYTGAAAWVAAMNAANYLGHSNWQMPTSPMNDKTCAKTGPTGGNFGFGCQASAFSTLFYSSLGLKAPDTAVPIPSNTLGPFSNLQPYIYWSQTSAGSAGYATFSFGNGFQGANTAPNFMYVLPMIPGKIAGTPAASGTGLQVNPGGQTVYDPVTNVTWLANANLAATNTFGLPACKDPTTPTLCVDKDGAMSWDAASQFIANMNSAAYLGQKNWELPPIDENCNAAYVCDTTGSANPFAELFYAQLGVNPGTPAVPAPNVAVGPFHNVRPYLYWTCGADTIQDPCTYIPAPNFEWSFSWGSGFLGTDLLKNDLNVTAYFVGSRTSTTGPVIAEVANAEGESPVIAPNTWLEIKGANLAPANDMRIWQGADFLGDQMPTQLDQISATVNGKSAFVYYISPTQINILTPPDAISGPVQVVVNSNGVTSLSFTAQAQPLSPSFFVFDGAHLAATHLNGTFIGPTTLFPGYTTPAKPGETVVLYGNGFGPTSTPVISGLRTQTGTLATLPVIKIAGEKAEVTFAGLTAAGEFQFNVNLPPDLADGDLQIIATYSGLSTPNTAVITIQH